MKTENYGKYVRFASKSYKYFKEMGYTLTPFKKTYYAGYDGDDCMELSHSETVYAVEEFEGSSKEFHDYLLKKRIIIMID